MPDRTGRMSEDRCLGDEVLSAYIDGKLDVRERADVEAHLASCAECYDVMSEVLRIQEAVPAARPMEDAMPTPFSTPSAWPARKRRDAAASIPRPGGDSVLRGAFGRRRAVWAKAGVALAAAAALLLVVRLQPEWWTGGVDPRLADLVEAVGEERTVEARLTGGFKYGPLRSPLRSGGRVGPTDNWSLLAAAGKIREEAEKNPTPENLHALGVACLLAGNVDEGIGALQRSLEASPSPRCRSDLAAGYIAKARQTSERSLLEQAVGEASRAFDESGGSLSEAKFNEAYALTALGRTREAREAWDAYLQKDSESQWSLEARTHLERLR